MKRLLILIILMFSGLSVQAQELTEKEKERMTLVQRVEAKADSLTKKFDAQLSMTEKQYMLFRKKAKNFMMKRRALMARDMPTEKKNEILDTYYRQEAGEMRDILKDYQFEVYTDIRSQIQPRIQLGM